MPSYQAPYSDAGRLAFLEKAIDTGRRDVAAGQPFITQALLDEMTRVYTDFDGAYKEVSARLGERVREVAQADEATARVKMYLRHLWDTVVNRAERLGLSGTLQFYHLPDSGERPHPTQRKEWFRLAEDVISGDAQAVAAGFAPVQEPTAAELQAVLTAARREAGEIEVAELAYDQAQERVEALRGEADALIREIVEVISFATRKEDAPSQRRLLRRYGATYRYLPGETPEEGDEVLGLG